MEDVSSIRAHTPNNVSNSVTHGLPVGETLHKEPKEIIFLWHMPCSLVGSIYVLETIVTKLCNITS